MPILVVKIEGDTLIDRLASLKESARRYGDYPEFWKLSEWVLMLALEQLADRLFDLPVDVTSPGGEALLCGRGVVYPFCYTEYERSLFIS